MDQRSYYPKRFTITLLSLLLLTIVAPLPATAQRGGQQPMWIDRIAVSHEPGPELADPLILRVNVHVTSRDGAVPGATVSIIVVGPANERIPARATTDRNGNAQIVTQVPGGGPYDIFPLSAHGEGYVYESGFDTYTFSGYYFIPLAGNVFVSDNNYEINFRRIQVFTKDGIYVREWHPVASSTSAYQYVARDLALDSAGYLYVSILGDNSGFNFCEIHKYTSYGALVNVIPGACEIGTGQLENIRDIAVDSHDNLIVVDGIGKLGHVDVYNSNGAYLSTSPIPFDVNIATLILDSNDNLYLGDISSDQIHKFNPNGTHLTSWSTVGEPYSLTFDSAGRILASGPGVKLQAFDTQGGLLATWPFSFWYLDADDSGLIFGTRKKVSVDVYTLSGTLVDSWGAHGTGAGQFTTIYRIAVFG